MAEIKKESIVSPTLIGGAVVVAALMLGQRIGQLKERAKNAEDKANRNKRNAEIAARPPADPAVPKYFSHILSYFHRLAETL